MAFNLLADSIKYLITPAPRHLRTMGYVRELRALGARRDRCRAAWQPHLEKTRTLILEAADLCATKNKALILGSGLLFDIPVAELSQRFKQVVLVDIVHLWKVHRQIRQYPNVHLVQQDITGVVEQIYAMSRRRRLAQLPNHKPDYFLEDGFDLIVSVNILSQLPVILNGYLSARTQSLADNQLADFSRCLVENHLDWLSAFPGLVCLIADLERLQYDDSRLISREASLWGVALPAGGQRWYWDLAPRPEMDFRLDIRHHVVGYARFPKQAWLERGRAQATS